ncbi:hypothetical protein GKZ90_0012340 [Flavobacterium sp. MC2016-06]|uniref:hypothetical protein n=1 Tax=Flavobacterium sp. MC2016-06 TaxID=2676308 RepID=UPI0012BAC356|nr:hypothetical protein [Flavobacterium sp. MC2016-06]MBU3862407.1 hypothetical protein [Flavobacterium sp. MC2016-06]
MCDVEGIDELLVETKIVAPQQFIVFKQCFNKNNSIVESGDFVIGIVEDMFINAIYLGGDTTLLKNFDVITQTASAETL